MTTPNDAAASGANNNAGQGAGAPGNTGASGSTGTGTGDAGKGSQGATQGADERYGAPEAGYDPKGAEQFTDALRADLHAYGKSHNLSQKAMTAMYDVATKHARTQAEELDRTHKANLAEWGKASAADKEFGGEAYEANKAVMGKALDTFGTPELRKILADSGLQGHPEFARLLYRVGKAVSEDKLARGGAASGGADAGGFVFSYPNSQHA
jgi:hypothetical protein